MPVAFNPPPFPTADAAITAAGDGAVDTQAIPTDAFALLLLAAGGDPGAIAGKDAGTTPSKGRLLDPRGERLVAENRGAVARISPRDPLSPIEPATGEGTADSGPAPSAEPSLDPAAMAAALGAVMAAGLKGETPGTRDLAGGPSDAGATTDALVSGARSLEPRTASGTLSPAIFNAASAAPAAGPRASLPDGRTRIDVDSPPATSIALVSTAAMRASDTLGMAGAPQELAGEPGPKRKDASDAGMWNVAMGAFAAGQPATAAVSTAIHTIDTPVTAPGWDSEFAGKLAQVVMLRNDRAEFHLHPAELGPVDVQISFASDQAVVLITAADATTRSALEQALPHLRDMLANQGIALGQASVQGERNPADADGNRSEAAPWGTAAQDAPEATVRAIALRGLVDVFA